MNTFFYRFFKNSVVIVLGPIITFFLYFANERPSDISDILPILKILLLMSIITLLFSIITHVLIENFKKGMIVSIIISELTYIVSLITFFWLDPINQAENIMWLPVAIVFLIPFSLPMAFSISYGCGKIIRDIKNGF